MPEVLTAALKNVAAVVREGYEGAEILGVHFEGPYLDMDYKGAQPPEAIAKPDVEQFKRYQEAADGLIRYITLAPEHDEGFALTKYCSRTGVVVSMGHSSASYEQALLGIANGATSMTHVYNGMTAYHHRKPGLVGHGFPGARYLRRGDLRRLPFGSRRPEQLFSGKGKGLCHHDHGFPVRQALSSRRRLPAGRS